MDRFIVVGVILLTLLIGLSAFAGTPQDWGKWKKGELLLENQVLKKI